MTEKIRINWITVLMLIIFWGVCASFYPQLPEQVPTHWNLQGEVDDYSHKAVASLIMPALPLLIYILMTVTAKIDPKKENYSKFGVSYEKIRMAIVLIMMGFSTIALLPSLGYDIDIGIFARIMVPLLFIFIGNYMGKIRHNYFIGIKVPWTLASEEVWTKTHRLGGRLMVIGGVIALLGAFATPTIGFAIMMAGVILPSIISMVYSYLLYQKIVN